MTIEHAVLDDLIRCSKLKQAGLPWAMSPKLAARTEYKPDEVWFKNMVEDFTMTPEQREAKFKTYTNPDLTKQISPDQLSS